VRFVLVLGEGFELCQWHEVLGLCRERAIHGYQGVGLEFGDGKVLRVIRRTPVLLARDLPGGTARHSVTEQPHLQLREALVVLKRQLLGEVTVPHGPEKQGKCLGTDEVRGDYLMPRTCLETLGDEVYEGRGVDYVLGHVSEH
jgi:hypothetical protein